VRGAAARHRQKRPDAVGIADDERRGRIHSSAGFYSPFPVAEMEVDQSNPTHPAQPARSGEGKTAKKFQADPNTLI
jgi:hypothetical protein